MLYLIKKKLFLILSIGLFICFALSILLHAKDKKDKWWQHHYEKGMDLLNKGQFTAAEEEFRSILVRNSKIAEAYYGLGMVYAKNKEGSKTAIDFFKKATKIKSDYAMAYYQIALVYELLPNEEKNVLEYLRETTEKDPNFLNGWYKLALVLVDFEKPQTSILGLSEEVKRNPKFKEPCATFILDSLKTQFPKISNTSLDLLRAKALFELEKEDEGLEFYWSAVNSIKDSSDAEAIFNDVCYIMENKEYSELKETPLAELKEFYTRFWLKRDPNITTEKNERIIEHYRRITYAYKHYGRTNKSQSSIVKLHRFRHPFRKYTPLGEIMGDDMLAMIGFPEAIPKKRTIDDLGLVYIRHGEPDKKVTAVTQNVGLSDLPPKLVSFLMDEDAEMSENLQQMWEWHHGLDMQPQNVSWKYNATRNRPEMVLHFVKYGNETGWIVEAVPSSLDNREMLGPKYHELRKALLAAQFAEIALERIEAQQGQDIQVGDIYSDFTIKIPRLVTEVKEANLDHIKHSISTETSEFTFDNEPLEFRYNIASFKGEDSKNLIEMYYAVEGRKTKLSGTGRESKVLLEQSLAFYEKDGEEIARVQKEDDIKVGLTAEQWGKKGVLGLTSLSLEPGSYNFEIHLKDKEADRLGVYKGLYDNENYWKSKLHMSDVLLISDIRPSKKDDEFVKGDIAFRPRMFSNFKQYEKVGVYFEAYNLSYDPSQKTDYKINYKLKPVQGSSVFKKVFGLFKKNKETISSEYHYSGDQKNEKLYLNFDLSNRPPGEYEITIEVKDLIKKQVVSKKVSIKVAK